MSDISKAYISSLIPKGAIILDVGSYDGKDAVGLADACNTTVHCFEPVSYELIVNRNDPRLIIWPYALTNKQGIELMNISTSHNQSNSIKTPKEHIKIFPEIVYDKLLKINCITLDSWNKYNAPIDFIWIDCNGSEADFILGATQTLAITKFVYIEYCEKELFNKALNRVGIQKALPGFETLGDYNFKGNFGNLLMKNKNEKLWQDLPIME